MKLTLVETGVALLADNALESLGDALLLGAVSSNVHLALDGDVGVSHRSGKELAKGAEEEGDRRGHLSTLLDIVLHLLEQSVLQNGVDDEHQGWHDTSEEGLGTLVLEESHQRADGGRVGLLLDSLLKVALLMALVGGDAGVDNPDGVGDDDGRGTGNGTGNHRLDGGELLVGATSSGSSLLEELLGPLIPVVVDEVGDADAEEGRVDSGIETGNAFAGNDSLDGIDELALGLLGFDLGAGREGDEGIATETERLATGYDGGARIGRASSRTSGPWTRYRHQLRQERERHCRFEGWELWRP